MEKTRILELVAESIEVDPGKLDSEANLREDKWDSLADIIFVGKIDDEYGVTINSDDLRECRTADDFANAVLNANG